MSTEKVLDSYNIVIEFPETESDQQQALLLAKVLSLPVIPLTETKQYHYGLSVLNGILRLKAYQEKFNPIVIDFSQGEYLQRTKQLSQKSELIAKAVGIKKDYRPDVIDATAGLALDAYILACFGCQVTMLERSPIMQVLLENAIAQTLDDSLQSRLQLVKMDAIDYLKKLTVKVDVIYLDPMFPERNKSALVKKEMRVLKNIVGQDVDAEELFLLAMTKAKKRIVVKRPKLAPYLNHQKPDIQYHSGPMRFDVYVEEHR